MICCFWTDALPLGYTDLYNRLSDLSPLQHQSLRLSPVVIAVFMYIVSAFQYTPLSMVITNAFCYKSQPKSLVRMVGFEPTMVSQQILSLPRIPFRHIRKNDATSDHFSQQIVTCRSCVFVYALILSFCVFLTIRCQRALIFNIFRSCIGIRKIGTNLSTFGCRYWSRTNYIKVMILAR